MGGKQKGTVYVLICVTFWALIPLVAKSGQVNLDNHQFLFWSSIVSFLVLISATAITGNLKYFFQYRLKDWLHYSLLGLLGTYFYYIFLYFGYANAKGMEVLVLQYTWPIFIVIFSIFILKEKLTPKKLLSVAIGFLGVAIVLTKGDYRQVDLENISVLLFVMAGASCAALFSVLSKKVHHEPCGVTSLYFLSACIAALISMLYFSNFSLPSTSDVLPVLLNGVLVNGLSYVLWLLALKKTEASYLAPFVFLSPILSAVYLMVLFHEPYIPAYGLGLLCVIAAGVVNSLGTTD